jgi:hypothetical protein
MAVRDAALVTRSARACLAPATKHWRVLEQGLHLGYRAPAALPAMSSTAIRS